MNCPFCGTPVDEGDAFCQNCGKRVEEKEVELPEATLDEQPTLDFGGETEDEPTPEMDWKKLLADKKVIYGLVILAVLIVASSAYFIFFASEEFFVSVCGDNICSDDETVTSCEIDCKPVTVRKGLGGSCYTNNDCSSANCCGAICVPSGEPCSDVPECIEDFDCNFGYTCTYQKCVKKPECEDNDDCSTGEVCNNGFCVEEDECEVDSDCPTDETCDNNQCVAEGLFSLSIIDDCEGLECEFVVQAGLQKKDIDYIEWAFDEGPASFAADFGTEEFATTWTYSDYGQYTISLTVENDEGVEVSATKVITLTNDPPNIDLSVKHFTNPAPGNLFPETGVPYEYSTEIRFDLSETTDDDQPIVYSTELQEQPTGGLTPAPDVRVAEKFEIVYKDVSWKVWVPDPMGGKNVGHWVARHIIPFRVISEATDAANLKSTAEDEYILYPNTLQQPQFHMYPEWPCINDEVKFWVTNVQGGCLRDPEGDVTAFNIGFGDGTASGAVFIKSFGQSCPADIVYTTHSYPNKRQYVLLVITGDHPYYIDEGTYMHKKFFVHQFAVGGVGCGGGGAPPGQYLPDDGSGDLGPGTQEWEETDEISFGDSVAYCPDNVCEFI